MVTGYKAVDWIIEETKRMEDALLAPLEVTVVQFADALRDLGTSLCGSSNWVGFEAYQRAFGEGFVINTTLKDIRVISKKNSGERPLSAGAPSYQWFYAALDDRMDYASFLVANSIICNLTRQQMSLPFSTENDQYNLLRFKVKEDLVDVVSNCKDTSKARIRLLLWRDYKGKYGISLELLGIESV